MSDTKTVSRGITFCPCPVCGEEDALSVNVGDGLLHCGECNSDLTAEELEARAKSYLKLAAWMRLVPTFAFGEEPS